MRHVQIAGKTEDNPQAVPTQLQPQELIRLEITPDLIEALRQVLTGVMVVEEAPDTPQLPLLATEIQSLEHTLKELDRLLPNVSLEEITAVVTAFRMGIQRRNMCAHLLWGSSKSLSE